MLAPLKPTNFLRKVATMDAALTPSRCSPKSDGNEVNTVPTFGAIVFVVTSSRDLRRCVCFHEY